LKPELDAPSVTPEEAIQSAEDAIAANLRSQLLSRIAELSPTFFERLVVDLIAAMGYGGNRQMFVLVALMRRDIEEGKLRRRRYIHRMIGRKAGAKP
jgi:restriction endonuclease Mrr